MPHSLLSVDLLACISAYPAFSLMLESMFQGTLLAAAAKSGSRQRLVVIWHPSIAPAMAGWRNLHCVMSRPGIYLKEHFSVCLEVSGSLLGAS